MRRSWWVLLVPVLLASGMLFLNLFDDPIDPGAKAWIDASVEDVPPQQNMYYAALGFDTTGDDPEQAGRDQARQAMTELKNGADPDTLILHQGPRLQFAGDRTRLPGPGDFKAALDFTRQHPEETARLLMDNRRIIERYAHLYVYPRYVDPMPKNISGLAVMPDWGLINFGKRLRTLELARDLPRSGPGPIIAWLLEDQRFWRRMIAEDSTGLLGKMVMAAQLRADFQIASQLVHLVPLNASQLDALREVGAALGKKEQGLQGVWKSEFQWSAGVLMRNSYEQAAAGKDVSWGERVKLKAWSLFFLRNATLNLGYRRMLRLVEIDSHECSRYSSDRADMLKAGDFNTVPWRLIRNPVGRVLVDLTDTAYLDYAARMCDLQGFQRLLGLQVLLRQRNPADADIPALLQSAGTEYADPYTNVPMQWLPGQRALGFDAHGKREKDMLPWPI